MSNAKTPQRVVWSEGMLVSPQHLQQADLYHERLLDARLAALSPRAWGVASLEIDSAALAAEQLKLLRFSGVLPDGLVVTVQNGDPDCPAATPLAGRFPPTRPALEVYLAARAGGLPGGPARA